MGGAHIIESEVRHEHIHPGFAKDPELTGFDMIIDEGLHIRLGQVPLTGDPVDLVMCGGNADVRVEPASRTGDEIDRYRQRIGRVRYMKGFDSCVHRTFECRVRGAEVRT